MKLTVLRQALALLLLPAAVALAAPRAEAQRVSIGFGKQHGSIGVSAGITFGAPHYRPPVHAAPVRCAPVWVPGHYALVERRVYVPGCVRTVYVPAVYEDRCWRDYCGRLHVEKVLVSAATWRSVQDPGSWKCVSERVWVEGAWRR